MNKREKATSMFKEGFSCSQAILATFGEELNLDKHTLLKLSDSFGGGMGRMALTCGAVTGAFMVIGLQYGRISADDRKAKEKTNQCVRGFIQKFKERNQTIVCKELLDCDIRTDEGLQYAKDHNLLDTICPRLVADSAEILEEMLE